MERKTVRCPSTKAEGTKPCGFELFSCFNLCPICGAEVKQKWFQEGIKVQELNVRSESNRDELQHGRSSIITEDENKDKDQNRGVENTDSEKEKEEREGNEDNNEVTSERKISEVVYEREKKSVREIQSEEEDKGGGPNKEMEKRQNNMEEDHTKEEEILDKGNIKYGHETIRKEAIGKEKVSKNDDKEIKDENDLKKDNSWISDNKKTVNVEMGTEEGEKGYSNVKKEEKEQSWRNDSREANMKDKKNTEEDQTGTKKAKEMGISEERLEGVEEREHASLPLLKAPLQRSTLSDEKEEREELEKDGKGEDIKDKTNNKVGQTGTKKTGKMVISEERLEGSKERGSASLTLSKVPLQRSTLSDEMEERKELEEDRRGNDIKNKKNNEEGQTNTIPQGNMGISEERLEGNEEREYASLPLPSVQSQRSPLSNETEEKEDREEDR